MQYFSWNIAVVCRKAYFIFGLIWCIGSKQTNDSWVKDLFSLQLSEDIFLITHTSFLKSFGSVGPAVSEGKTYYGILMVTKKPYAVWPDELIITRGVNWLETRNHITRISFRRQFISVRRGHLRNRWTVDR